MRVSRKIVFTTLGSLGDLHPYLAIALGLKARGHEAIVATGDCYRAKIESLGLGYRPLRPGCAWVTDIKIMRRFMGRLGLVRIGTELVLPALRDSYEDTLAAAEGADLLISQIPFAARLVAEKTGIPWVSTIHIPLLFFSAHDLGVFPLSPFLFRTLRRLRPEMLGPLLRLGKWATRRLARPWYQFRAELGLPPGHDDNPLGDSHSPLLVLALFSRLLADKQPDWPRQTVITGFPLFDSDGPIGLPSELARFLDAGPPPIVFTLGTAVAVDAGSFFIHSAAAAKQLGFRAVFLLKHSRNRPLDLPDDAIAVDYAPYSEAFPRAAAIVHHGGVGSTGLAMRAGRPMLIVPRAWDQPDHAERIARLGIGRMLPFHRYNPAQAVAELLPLLHDPGYALRAQEIAAKVRQENGVQAACDALEGVLAWKGLGSPQARTA
jgi:UDP:flavonoid glycosyltransferase YjiC (YdhE family)